MNSEMSCNHISIPVGFDVTKECTVSVPQCRYLQCSVMRQQKSVMVMWCDFWMDHSMEKALAKAKKELQKQNSRHLVRCRQRPQWPCHVQEFPHLISTGLYCPYACYNLRPSSGCNLGKDLRKSKGFVQLVKCKDTGVYLCYIYIYESTMRQRSTIHKAIKSYNMRMKQG